MIQDELHQSLAWHPQNAPLLVRKGTLDNDGEMLIIIGQDSQYDPDIKQQLEQTHTKLLVVDRIEEVVEKINRSMIEKPNDSALHSLKGECYVKMGKYVEAIELLDKAIALDPQNVFGPLYKGIALIRLQKYKEGIEWLKKSLEIEPKNVQAWNTKGNAEYRANDLVEAIYSWEAAIKLNPEYDQAYNNIGIALNEQGKANDSLFYFNKALQISPNHPLYYCNRGIAYLRLDQEKALEDFQKAKELISDPLNLLQIGTHKQTFIQKRILLIAELEEKKQKFKDLLTKLQLKKETFDQIKTTLNQVEDSSHTSYRQSLSDDQSDAISLLSKKLDDIQQVLNKTGLQEKYDMKLALDDMEEHGGIEGNLQKEYYCAFYWTLLEYLTAYQQLSLNVFKAGSNAYQFDKQKEDTSKKMLYEIGAKYIGEQVKKLAEKVPIVGNVIEFLDQAVDQVLTTRKENLFLKKIRAINDIIQYKKGETLAYEDLSITLQSAAFTLCQKQKTDIVARVKSKQQHIGQEPQPTEAWKVFLNALQEFRDKILATNKTDMFQGEASAMALEDVLSVLVYFFDQYELIVNSKEKLRDIIVNLVMTQKAKTFALQQISLSDPHQDIGMNPERIQPRDEKLRQDGGCCLIF